MNDQTTVAKILRSLADCIESSSGEEISGLLAGRLRLRITPERGDEIQKRKPKRPLSTARNWVEIADQMRALPSREAGQRFIEGLTPSRTDLEHLARAMDLPISKQDNTERLLQKIIESSIGSRLSSQAIRGD